jgi:YHS domain-containing protein
MIDVQMKQKRKNIRASKEKRTNKWEGRVINAFALFLFGGIFIWMGFIVYNESTEEKKMREQYLSSLPNLADTIAHRKVCMVDDIYQGDYPTLPAKFDNRTYYGCDSKAVRELTTKNEFRTATDPVTGKRIDKATAVIAIHPKRDGKVLYFESSETFTKYLSKHN